MAKTDATPRPEGVLERILHSLEMCETYLGLLVKQQGGTLADKPVKKEKAEPKATTKKAKEPTPDPDLDLEVDATPALPTIEDCRNALKKYQALEGREGAIQMLRDFKAQNVSTLPEDQRQAFIDRCLGNS